MKQIDKVETIGDLKLLYHNGDRNYIGTYNGDLFWPLSPSKKDVSIECIVQALCKTNRFNGHTLFPYTVAQHSIMVSEMIEERLGLYNKQSNSSLGISKYSNTEEKDSNYMRIAANPKARNIAILMGLLHDASEAYLSDIVRPLKKHLSGYLEIEDSVQRVIYSTFGINIDNIEDIKTIQEIVTWADNYALVHEVKEMMNPCSDWVDMAKLDTIHYSDKYSSLIHQENQQYVFAKFIRKLFSLLANTGIHDEFEQDPLYKSWVQLDKDFKKLIYFNAGEAEIVFNDSISTTEEKVTIYRLTKDTSCIGCSKTLSLCALNNVIDVKLLF